MVLDNREQFTGRGLANRSRTEGLHMYAQRICDRSSLKVDTRCINIGDVTWVAR